MDTGEGNPVPRVWPVFLAYVAVFAGLLLAGMAIVLVRVGSEIASAADPDPQAIVASAKEFTSSPASLVLGALVSSLVLLLVPVLVVHLSRASLSSRLRTATGRATILWSAVFVVGFLSLSQMIDSTFALVGWSDLGTIGLITEGISEASPSMLLAAVLVIGLAAGFCEEIFFRGYMQTRLRERWGPWPAIAITSAAFGLVHIDPFHTTFAFLAGISLGWMTELTGSIRPAMAAHAVNNSLSILLTWLLAEPLSTPVHGLLLGLSLTLGMVMLIGLRLAYPGGVRAVTVAAR